MEAKQTIKESNFGMLMRINRDSDSFGEYIDIEDLFNLAEDLLKIDLNDYHDAEFIKPFFEHLLKSLDLIIKRLNKEIIFIYRFSARRQRERLLEKLSEKRIELQKVLVKIYQDISLKEIEKNKDYEPQSEVFQNPEIFTIKQPNHPGTNTLQ
jgi:hypothetical protein